MGARIALAWGGQGHAASHTAAGDPSWSLACSAPVALGALCSCPASFPHLPRLSHTVPTTHSTGGTACRDTDVPSLPDGRPERNHSHRRASMSHFVVMQQVHAARGCGAAWGCSPSCPV